MTIEQTSVHAHSSLLEYEFDGDDLDKYYLPVRGLVDAYSSTKQGHCSVAIVPKNLEIQNLAAFYKKTISKNGKMEIIETPDSQYLMDRDIANDPEIIQALIAKLNKCGHMELNPYGVTEELMTWAQPIIEEGAILVGDNKRYLDRLWWGHKAGLHRWVDNLSTPSFSDTSGIPVARGFVAKNTEEALKAATLLGTQKVILKPYILSGGFDMKRCGSVSDIETYKFPQMPEGMGMDGNMPVAVEELLEIDKDLNGEELVYSMQFIGTNILGPMTKQLIHGGKHWVGNAIPSGATATFELKAKKVVELFLKRATPLGPGGVDLASVGGEPVVLEVNGGRPTGAHNPKNFHAAFAPKSPSVIFEKEDNIGALNLDVETVWDKLSKSKYKGLPIAFNEKTGRGVYPIVWLKNMWSMLISFAETPEIARALLEEAKSLAYTK